MPPSLPRSPGSDISHDAVYDRDSDILGWRESGDWVGPFWSLPTSNVRDGCQPCPGRRRDHPSHGGSRDAEVPAGMSALARRILPICLISGRCAPDCGMAQHGDGAVAWMVGASRPSPGQKDGTGALFAKPPPEIGRAHV